MESLSPSRCPADNSAAYMDHCVRTLLEGGDDIEIILVDDGSTKDDTPPSATAGRESTRTSSGPSTSPTAATAGVNQGLRTPRDVL